MTDEERKRAEVEHTRRQYQGIGKSPRRRWGRAVDEREAEGYDWSPMVDAVTGASDVWYPMVYAVADGTMTLQEGWREVEHDVKDKAGKGWHGFAGLDVADMGYLKRSFKEDIRAEMEELKDREESYGFEADPEFAERFRRLHGMNMESAIEAGVRAALRDVLGEDVVPIESVQPKRGGELSPEDVQTIELTGMRFWFTMQLPEFTPNATSEDMDVSDEEWERRNEEDGTFNPWMEAELAAENLIENLGGVAWDMESDGSGSWYVFHKKPLGVTELLAALEQYWATDEAQLFPESFYISVANPNEVLNYTFEFDGDETMSYSVEEALAELADTIRDDEE